MFNPTKKQKKEHDQVIITTTGIFPTGNACNNNNVSNEEIFESSIDSGDQLENVEIDCSEIYPADNSFDLSNIDESHPVECEPSDEADLKNQPITFKIINNGSKNGEDLLRSSDGFCYTLYVRISFVNIVQIRF